MWIKFANLCRKSDRMALAGKTINTLLDPHVGENVSSMLRLVSSVLTLYSRPLCSMCEISE